MDIFLESANTDTVIGTKTVLCVGTVFFFGNTGEVIGWHRIMKKIIQNLTK